METELELPEAWPERPEALWQEDLKAGEPSASDDWDDEDDAGDWRFAIG